jgi:hypothetical protein
MQRNMSQRRHTRSTKRDSMLRKERAFKKLIAQRRSPTRRSRLKPD